ncbi:MAG: hypothetical protein LBR45_00180 [Bacteroidales bacterium]|nr:hypothetical protein [Bacteroidales bacterium]
MKIISKAIVFFTFIVAGFLCKISAQEFAHEIIGSVQLLARPAQADSIMLRYAPINKETWKLANTYGYVIERHTILRKGELVSEREKVILTAALLKPQPLDNWQQYETVSKYVPIAAECIFGESVVPLISPVAIAQRYKEEQNKFSFALFAADQSPLVAQLSGLAFTDKTAMRDEKYLYTVYVAAPDSLHIDTAFVFTGLSEYTPLPKPLDLTAQWKDMQVALSWDILSLSHIYNSYILEKSIDGKNYAPLSTGIFIQAADEGVEPERAYRSDTFPDNNTVFYYRIRGINAFGETGPPSDSVFGQGQPQITQAPVILNKQVIDNNKVKLDWEYPEKLENYITGFRVYRSANPNAAKEKIHEGINPQERSFTDSTPELTNYYIVSVYNGSVEKFSAGLSYAELIDSTPPAPPVGLIGEVDSLGVVFLTWKANTEKDIKGYRVFRSNHPQHEFMNIHSSVVLDTLYIDTININTLTKNVYYRVMAIDLRENRSDFGEILQLKLPDKIPPVAPVIKDILVEKNRLTVNWLGSSSEDVLLHRIYRKDELNDSLVEIAQLSLPANSYIDKNIVSGMLYTYQVRAEDDSKLLSAYSPPVSVKAFGEKKGQELILKVNAEQDSVVLSWVVGNNKTVEKILVYKAVEDGALRLLGGTSQNNFIDKSVKFGTTVRYRIKAEYTDGTSSDFSKEVKVSS